MSRSKTKKLFSFSNLFTALAFGFLLAILFLPGFKGEVIKVVMKTGLLNARTKTMKERTPLSDNKADDILLVDEHGKMFPLSTLKGKVIFINVWATWCPPCKAELPSIAQMKEALKETSEVLVLTLDADRKPFEAANYLRANGLDLPVLAVSGVYPEFLNSRSIPLTVVLDKEGYLVYKRKGVADYANQSFVKFIKDLTAS